MAGGTERRSSNSVARARYRLISYTHNYHHIRRRAGGLAVTPERTHAWRRVGRYYVSAAWPAGRRRRRRGFAAVTLLCGLLTPVPGASQLHIGAIGLSHSCERPAPDARCIPGYRVKDRSQSESLNFSSLSLPCPLGLHHFMCVNACTAGAHDGALASDQHSSTLGLPDVTSRTPLPRDYLARAIAGQT